MRVPFVRFATSFGLGRLLQSAQVPAALVLVTSAASLIACADENDPATWVKRLDDPARRSEAIGRLKGFFEMAMQDSKNNREDPKLKKVLTKKVLDHLATLSEEQPAEYRKFYDEFGNILRTGVSSDFENREKVAGLLRFHSTYGDDRDAVISLADYLKRAAEGQTQIYYLTGLNRDTLAAHPRLEAFRRRNLEVLLLDDPVDEFALVQLRQFQEKDLISIDSADVKFPESTNPVDLEVKSTPKHFPRVLELFRGALAPHAVVTLEHEHRVFGQVEELVEELVIEELGLRDARRIPLL